jgi:hypothetical protein
MRPLATLLVAGEPGPGKTNWCRKHIDWRPKSGSIRNQLAGQKKATRCFGGKSIDSCSPARFKRDWKIDERKVGRRWLEQERKSKRKPKKIRDSQRDMVLALSV